MCCSSSLMKLNISDHATSNFNIVAWVPQIHTALASPKSNFYTSVLLFLPWRQLRARRSHSPVALRACKWAGLGMRAFRAFFFACQLLLPGIRVRYFLRMESEGCTGSWDIYSLSLRFMQSFVRFWWDLLGFNPGNVRGFSCFNRLTVISH